VNAVLSLQSVDGGGLPPELLELELPDELDELLLVLLL
jgi:hypothetical protein